MTATSSRLDELVSELISIQGLAALIITIVGWAITQIIRQNRFWRILGLLLAVLPLPILLATLAARTAMNGDFLIASASFCLCASMTLFIVGASEESFNRADVAGLVLGFIGVTIFLFHMFLDDGLLVALFLLAFLLGFQIITRAAASSTKVALAVAVPTSAVVGALGFVALGTSGEAAVVIASILGMAAGSYALLSLATWVVRRGSRKGGETSR